MRKPLTFYHGVLVGAVLTTAFFLFAFGVYRIGFNTSNYSHAAQIEK